MNLIIQCVTTKYVKFSGRARRKEFWLFNLTYLILLFLSFGIDGYLNSTDANSGYGFISGLFILILALPTIAVSIRRLHDTNRSGWWYLLTIIPLGIIVLYVFYCFKGTKGPNKFGPDPLAH